MLIQAGSRYAIMIGLSMALSLGCGGPNQYVVQGAPPAAGADGNISVGDFDDGNAEVEIEVANLPPANRVEEDATVYIVWFKGDGAPAKAGQLAYDDDERTGTLHATSPNREFTVLITAEEEADASSPSEHVVFRQDVEVP